MHELQEKGPLPGLETGLLFNTRKWNVRGDTFADKARDFIGKGRLGGEQQGKGAQENWSAMWLAVSAFMVMGLVSGLSLASHSDSESFLVAPAMSSQDGCQREGFWEVVGHVVSPFDLSRTLPVGGGLLVPCSLPGPPVIRQSWKWWPWCLARVDGFSQRASPNISRNSFATGPSFVSCLCLYLAAFQSLLSGAGSLIIGFGGN